MFGMVARLVLDYSNTLTIAALFTAVLSYHVQLTNAILETNKTINKVSL